MKTQGKGKVLTANIEPTEESSGSILQNAASFNLKFPKNKQSRDLEHKGSTVAFRRRSYSTHVNVLGGFQKYFVQVSREVQSRDTLFMADSAGEFICSFV